MVREDATIAARQRSTQLTVTSPLPCPPSAVGDSTHVKHTGTGDLQVIMNEHVSVGPRLPDSYEERSCVVTTSQ